MSGYRNAQKDDFAEYYPAPEQEKSGTAPEKDKASAAPKKGTATPAKPAAKPEKVPATTGKNGVRSRNSVISSQARPHRGL